MSETRTLDGAILKVLGEPPATPVLQIRREREREAIVLGPETRAWLCEQLAAFDPEPAPKPMDEATWAAFRTAYRLSADARAAAIHADEAMQRINSAIYDRQVGRGNRG